MREELKEVLESKCKWFDFEKGSDAPLINKKDVPYSIRKFFNFTCLKWLEWPKLSIMVGDIFKC